MALADLSSTATHSMDLLDIKALFLQEQYRKCTALCAEVLNEDLQPLQESFTRCYLAFAHDELARSMHNFSHNKLAALNEAEHLYRDALQSIPTTEQCITALVEPESEGNDEPLTEDTEVSRYTSPTTLGASGTGHRTRSLQSPALSTNLRNDSPMEDAFLLKSPGDAASDFDDLESHESYEQIMTPNRVVPRLERDYSSMSLLETVPPHKSEGLMRPIRLGELPRQYHVPPRMSYTNNSSAFSRLPRLQTSPSRSSPVRKQLLTASEQASPIESPASPVSPLGSESVASDASMISELSPGTPIADDQIDHTDPTSLMQRPLHFLDVHLENMRIQLETHIRLLAVVKEQTRKIQSERTAARLIPVNERTPAMINATTPGRQIQQSHSFWSFTPVDLKAVERQRRIEAGRRRGWMRARFDPTRYRQLAEKALAEL